MYKLILIVSIYNSGFITILNLQMSKILKMTNYFELYMYLSKTKIDFVNKMLFKDFYF